MSDFDAVIEAIDLANARDPRLSTEEGMAPVPQELIYGIRMSRMCDDYAPDADELVRIAARGQHIERWIIPREDFPRDKPGYFRWRNELKRHHAQRVSCLMAEHGYSEDAQGIVSDILLKKNLKRDPRTQTVEDLACLVFLQFYAPTFAKGHPLEKVVSILSKTLPKMSENAHDFVETLPLDMGLVEAIIEAKRLLSLRDDEKDR